MTSATRARGSRKILAVAAGLMGVFIAAGALAAPEPARGIDISPDTVKADSRQVPVFGVDLLGSGSLTGARVTFVNVAGFTAADLAMDSACESGDITACDGVQVWRDSSRGETDDVLDGGDTPLSTGFTFDGDCATVDYLPPDGVCAATLTMTSSPVPTTAEGAYTHFIVIRTSGTIAEGDRFEVSLESDAITTQPEATSTVPASTGVITADLTAPAAPAVGDLGLSKAAGIVRAGATAVSTEEKASLQVWRSADAACQGALVHLVSGIVGDLSKPNTDLIGLTAAERAAVQAFPAASSTVCYRIADEAGNLSGFVADGRVPAAPDAADVALLGASNLTDLKRIESAPDASAPRTFRLYLRPGGTGLERARTGDLTVARFVEVTTHAARTEASATTDIRRWNGLATIGAGDGVGYTRVNANGNDSAATADGSIPAKPGLEDLALLGTSAVDGHQRVTAAVDAQPGRTFRLFGDATGLGAWTPAATAAQDGAPVTVTTASSPASSGTTQIWIGDARLGAGRTVGFTAITAEGNGSDVQADGAIPSAPSASATSFSDATNTFRVSPFPVSTDGVTVRLFAGENASAAYGAGHRGQATSSTAVSVAELPAGLELHYSIVSAGSGNESPLQADGTIPAGPDASDLTALSTSAATGHQRVIADAAENPGRTFRLYGDPSGGTAWQQASSLAQASLPVEITTGAARVDSNGAVDASSIYFGTTALGSGHAIGFSHLVGGNDSDVIGDGVIPAAPNPAHVSVSDALDELTATSATSAYRVNLHTGSPADTAALAYDEAGADARATSSAPVSIADPAAGTTLYYTASDTATGNESPTSADGSIPAAPGTAETALLGVSAAQGHQRVVSTADPNGPRILRLYGNTGSGWARAHDGAGSIVELPTAVAVSTATNTTSIVLGGESLGAGHTVGYARRTTEGNDSDITADGAIPAAPSAGALSASAAANTVRATGVDAGMQIRAFASRSSGAATAYGEGADASLTTAFRSRPVTLSAGDWLHYSAVSDLTGHESALVTDGQIPSTPSAAATSASDARDEFVIGDASGSNRISIFLDASGTPSVAYDNGADFTNITGSPFAPGSDLPAQYVYYTATDATSGNESAILADGYIPVAPADAAPVMSASAARARIASNPDSVARRLRLWVDPTGSGAYRAASTTPGGTGTVEVLTSIGSEIVSDEGIFVGGTALGAGMGVGYTRLVSGNESDVAADGTIPAAPTNPAHFAADANAGTATISGAAPAGTYRVFGDTTPVSPRTLHTGGLTTTIALDGLTGGQQVGYARTDGGNESPVLADGTIPMPPALDLQSGSDTGSSNTDDVTADDTPAFDALTLPAGQVTFFQGGATVGSATANGAGVASHTMPAQPNGARAFTALVTAGGNTSPMSPATTITVDTIAPAAPGTPSLQAASDTGRSDADRITADRTPRFDLTAEPGSSVTLLDGATVVGSAAANGAGAAVAQASSLSDGTHAIGARATDLAGNVSPTSATRSVTIDTVAPAAPSVPDLQAGSDSGASDRDDVTNVTTPAFTVGGLEPDAYVRLRTADGARAAGLAGGDTITLTSDALGDGTHAFTANATDAAGNISSDSAALPVRIDTAAAAPSAPALDAGSDTGVSDADGITSLDEVTIGVTGAEPGATISLLEGTSALASTTAGDTGMGSVVIGLADGAHDLRARQTDVAGNTSAASSAARVVIDATAPTATIATPTELGGAATLTFSERVHGVTADNAVMRPAGSTATVPATVTTADDGRSATLRPVSNLVAGGSYTVLIVPDGSEAPTDVAGNTLGSTSRDFVAPRVQQEDGPATGAEWATVNASRAFGGSYVRERVAGASASYAFTGDSVTFYTVKTGSGGFARVSIDGTYVTTINTYARRAAFRSATTFNGLGAGPHTIEVTVGQSTPSGSSGTWVAIDAFKAGATIDTTPAMTYAWGSSSARRASGGRFAWSDQRGAVMSFTFKGSRADWITMKGRRQGRAQILVDGKRVRTVNTYATKTRYGVRYRVSGLDHGVHTLTIRVLGTKHSRARGTRVAVDRFIAR